LKSHNGLKVSWILGTITWRSIQFRYHQEFQADDQLHAPSSSPPVWTFGSYSKGVWVSERYGNILHSVQEKDSSISLRDLNPGCSAHSYSRILPSRVPQFPNQNTARVSSFYYSIPSKCRGKCRYRSGVRAVFANMHSLAGRYLQIIF
jgi:hypothetical protein